MGVILTEITLLIFDMYLKKNKQENTSKINYSIFQYLNTAFGFFLIVLISCTYFFIF